MVFLVFFLRTFLFVIVAENMSKYIYPLEKYTVFEISAYSKWKIRTNNRIFTTTDLKGEQTGGGLCS